MINIKEILEDSFKILIGCVVRNLAGVTHRVAELIERLHQLDDQFYNQPNQVEIIRTANQNSNLSTAGVLVIYRNLLLNYNVLVLFSNVWNYHRYFKPTQFGWLD